LLLVIMTDIEDNTCGACYKTVFGAATVALNRKYHPSCFKCSTCGELLTGEFYDQGGRPFCKKDFERRNLQACGLCTKTIENGSGSIHDREGNYYHDTCFICQKCNGSVVEGYFIVKGKRLCPHCNVDHNVEHKPAMTELGHCSSCCKRFSPGDAYLTVKDLRYHPPCVKCHYCKKVIDERREKYEYEQVTQILLTFCCENCIASGHADRCSGCGKIILVNSSTSAFGKPIHTKCFKCSKCTRIIKTTETFIKDGERPVCTECAK